jgi:two-component system, chemotaxis family, sensor kinase CheA
MDDLLREFLTETGESLDVVDLELVRFEREPNNSKIVEHIFRLVHTIKGTCGFLGLPRLEALTHAAETLMSSFRGGRPVTADAVSLVLATIDRIKSLLEELDRHQVEPHGSDGELIARLQEMAAKDLPAKYLPAKDLPAKDLAAKDLAAKDLAAKDLVAKDLVAKDLAAGAVREVEPTDATRENGGATPKFAATRSDPAAAPADPMGAEEDRANGRIAGSSIRVHVNTLDHLMTVVSELVLTRNQLTEIVRRHQDSEFKVPLQRLSHVTAELQEGVLKTRMQPIGNAWQKLPRIVRDLSAELKKPIELEMHGADTELDRQVLELIKDPLTHMVRNAADHGLELPEERIAAGKPERGTIRLSASHESGHILIEIWDDGRGLDIERISAKAVALGLATEADIGKLTAAQVQRFIFAPGFSTAEKITSVSGRGIGMDVVRTNIDKIGGSIDVSSERRRGTAFTVKIPLTLAIVSALIIEIAGDRFAIPQRAVLELVRVRRGSELSIERIKDSAVLRLRNKLLPLVDLKALLGIGARQEGAIQEGAIQEGAIQEGAIESGFIVVMQVGGQAFGVVVDSVFDTEEIVVKPMSSRLRQLALFCGNTILGDGSVILILEPNGIAQAIGMPETARRSQHRDRVPEIEETPTESMLVFRAGSPSPKAVPLSLVTRLEEIDTRTIELSNGRPIVQYRGQLMPLVPASGDVQIKSSGTQPLLVFSDDRRSMGLIVDEIVDIVEDRLEIELASENPGFLGSAVIKGQATEVIDIAHFLPIAFADWRHWKERPADGAMRRVLLIDDAPFFRNMLAPVVKAAGYSVTTVASASEALAVLESGQPFHFVLTDIEMPGMNGFDLASALRANPRTADVPIIGLTSAISTEAIERGKLCGLRDCVAKFDRRGLIAALKEQAAGVSAGTG